MKEQVAGGPTHSGSKGETRVGDVDVVTRQSSGPAALIGWYCVAAGVAGGCMGFFQERGPEGFVIGLVALVLGGLSAFVVGVATLVGRRWIQGPLLIVAGLGMAWIPVQLFVAVGSVPYFHG